MRSTWNILAVLLLATGCATDSLSAILAQDRNACASVQGQYLMANVKLQACRANDVGAVISVTPDGAISMDIRESIRAPIRAPLVCPLCLIRAPLVCPLCPPKPPPNIREPGISR